MEYTYYCVILLLCRIPFDCSSVSSMTLYNTQIDIYSCLLSAPSGRMLLTPMLRIYIRHRPELQRIVHHKRAGRHLFFFFFLMKLDGNDKSCNLISQSKEPIPVSHVFLSPPSTCTCRSSSSRIAWLSPRLDCMEHNAVESSNPLLETPEMCSELALLFRAASPLAPCLCFG